jgi:hypothetical protein
MKDKPYPLEDDRSQEFQESGAELLLEYGRNIWIAHHGCGPIEAMFDDGESSEEHTKILHRVQSELFHFFKDNAGASLKCHLCAPGQDSEIDIRIASALAYMAAGLVDSGHTSVLIFAVSSAVADVLPMQTPILEVRRIIAALAERGVLEVEEGRGKLNPSIRLGDPFVVDFFGKRCRPQLGQETEERSSSPAPDGKPKKPEGPEQKKLTQELGGDPSSEEHE